MAELVFCVHLPLLRMVPERLDLGAFKLWRMPFEVFDALSVRAYTDHRAAYEATGPVFLRVDMAFEPEPDGLVQPMVAEPGVAEFKLPTAHWPQALAHNGLGIVQSLHNDLVDRYGAALALAAPAALLPRARWSCTFAQVDENHALVQPGRRPIGQWRVQGDADLEYCFTPPCAGLPIDTDALVGAAEWQGLVDFVGGHNELHAALQALCEAGEPTLTPADQSILCTVALEALLLPELRSGLTECFTTRVSHLPGLADPAAARVLAAQLYDLRSAGLHGAAQTPDAEALVGPAIAAQWLAGAIVAAAHALRAGQTLDDFRAALDACTPPAHGAPDWSLQATPTGLRAPDRISPPVARQRFISRFSPDGLQGVADAYACYAPLVGLGCHTMQPLGTPPCPGFVPVSGQEVVSLEDRDIARDYLAPLRMLPEQYAALGIYTSVQGHADERAALQHLRRLRMLAVCALRLAGFSEFIDPELAGLHVLQESRPLLEPSVLRMSVLMRLQREPERWVSAEDQALTAPLWALMSRYQASGGHADIERWLGGLRRLHHDGFLADATRLGLGFALVEGLLGRFRAPGGPSSVEAMVARLLDASDPAAQWFGTQARGLRNALAHGRPGDADVPQAITHLRHITCAALPRAIALWLDQPLARPARLLMRSLGG